MPPPRRGDRVRPRRTTRDLDFEPFISLEVLTSLVIADGNVEVVQQSKARRKDDFLISFSPVIADATATAYKGATFEVQQKLKRVVDVWRQRAIFEGPIQDTIEKRLSELDKTRTAGSREKGLFGKSGPSVPTELVGLVQQQTAATKAAAPAKTAVEQANADYARVTDPSAPAPAESVHAARLNGVLKTLANAEGAVAESVKARRALVESLEELLKANRATLTAEEQAFRSITARKNEIDSKRKEVEDAIMSGLKEPTPRSATDGAQRSTTPEGSPPMESFTPPAFEPISPVAKAVQDNSNIPNIPQLDGGLDENIAASTTNATAAATSQSPPPPNVNDILATLAQGSYAQGIQNGINTGGSAHKKRKVLEEEVPALGDEEIDSDVAAMLKEEGGVM
jgi:regulator of Ty1 transposition protein 103